MAEWSARARREGRKVGFVPTMGALHEGHLDLVHRAREAHPAVVCSIFVNPLQFNNIDDLDRYPRQLEKDSTLLQKAGCDALFAPTANDLFCDFQPSTYDLAGLDANWEGPSRPGHFQGVVNVVERLFHYVRPDMAFFGEKDRQQLTLLRHIAKQELWPVRVTGCPTVRAVDGLALSSRNARLSAAERVKATVLYKALTVAGSMAFNARITEIDRAVNETLAGEPGVELDYFGIADHDSLEPLTDWGDRDKAVALIAAQVGPVRLIDNITLTR